MLAIRVFFINKTYRFFCEGFKVNPFINQQIASLKKASVAGINRMTSPAMTGSTFAAGDTATRSAMVELDQWIEQLYQCEQLTETQVKALCDKVYIF